VAELLRIATAGSVDDGKSTLIGRLLWDAKSIFEDQWEAIERSSAQRGDDYTNLALLTDGLRAEREQGITIDVAYRYFATPHRKFILADTPGHVQKPPPPRAEARRPRRAHRGTIPTPERIAARTRPQANDGGAGGARTRDRGIMSTSEPESPDDA
jgi:hypothetical protein